MEERSPAGQTRYYWDHENRLVRLDAPGVSRCFAYDPDGKRVAKEDASGLVRYVYQRDNMLELLQERDGAGNLLAHYTLGDGLESQRRGEESSFYHYDWLGSTHELTNVAQAMTDTYRYDAWGNVLQASGSTVNPHTYVGRLRYYAMAGTGLYQLGHRQLASRIARFVSEDPVRSGTNWYLYCRNAPSALLDPHGLHWQKAGGPNALPPNYPGRVHPQRWWNTAPLPQWVRSLIDRFGSVRGFLTGWLYHLIPPQTPKYAQCARMAAHWASAAGTDMNLRMEPVIGSAAWQTERGTVNDEVREAVASIERSRAPRGWWIGDHAARASGVMQSHSPDWEYAIGGHCGYGRAFVSLDNGVYHMEFTWRLEDTFSGAEWVPPGRISVKGGVGEWLAPFEFGGVAKGFWVNMTLELALDWRAGAFDQTYRDPVMQGRKGTI